MNDLVLDCPKMIGFRELTRDEVFCSDKAAAEAALRELGFGQLRVRHHGRVARIEVPPEQIETLVRPETRAAITAAIKGAGYTYVTVDLDGFRSGSMNESLGDS